MDEPTAAISVRQVAEVLSLIRRLRDQGIAVVLISHRMPDVFAVADRIVVLRRGAQGRRQADRGRPRPEEVTGLITGAIASRLMPTTNDSIAGRLHGDGLEDAVQRTATVALAVLVSQQTFWVFVAARARRVVLSFASDVFATPQNLFNVTRNFAFVGHHRASG